MPTPQLANGTGRTIEEAFKEAAHKLQSENPEFIQAKLIEVLYLAGDDPLGRIPQGEEGFVVTAQLVE